MWTESGLSSPTSASSNLHVFFPVTRWTISHQSHSYPSYFLVINKYLLFSGDFIIKTPNVSQPIISPSASSDLLQAWKLIWGGRLVSFLLTPPLPILLAVGLGPPRLGKLDPTCQIWVSSGVGAPAFGRLQLPKPTLYGVLGTPITADVLPIYPCWSRLFLVGPELALIPT